MLDRENVISYHREQNFFIEEVSCEDKFLPPVKRDLKEMKAESVATRIELRTNI